MEKAIEGVVQYANVGMINGKKVKFIHVEGFEDPIILDSVFGEEIFETIEPGKHVIIQAYVEEDDLGEPNWFVDMLDFVV